MRAWSRRHEFRGTTPQALRAWLSVILKSEVRQQRRYWCAQKRGLSNERGQMGLGAFTRFVRCLIDSCSAERPSRILMERERAERVQLAMSRLDAWTRIIVQRHVVDECTFTELAVELDIGDDKAVARAYRKGLEKLRRLLDNTAG